MSAAGRNRVQVLLLPVPFAANCRRQEAGNSQTIKSGLTGSPIAAYPHMDQVRDSGPGEFQGPADPVRCAVRVGSLLTEYR